MFSFLFSSVSCEEQQSAAHDIGRSDKPTDQIDNPEDAQAHKDELAEKQEEADGAVDEEEEEVEDQAEAIRAACGETKVCKDFMHHLEHCGERLEKGDTMVDNETCVEELFHYMHCVEDCAAPKIFAALKDQENEAALTSTVSSSLKSLAHLMLSHALSNRLSGGSSQSNPPLIVISDTLLQPSLLLTREFIHSALSSPFPSSASHAARANKAKQHVVLICAEQPPHKLLPPPGSYDASRVTVLDCSLPCSTYAPVASTSTSPTYGSYSTLDLGLPGAAQDLERQAADAIERVALGKSASGGEGGVLVVIDSANALADELEGGVGAVHRVVRGVLKALKGLKASRLLLVHHDDFPPPPPGPSSTTTTSSSNALLHPSLLRLLLSPTLSPSTLHLTLRPSAHLELLSRDYGLSVPLPSFSSSPDEDEEEEPDLRLGQFLASLAQRAVGDPFVRPEKAGEEDERVALDVLGAGAAALLARGGGGGGGRERPTSFGTGGGAGGCVVECMGRNGIKSTAYLAREKERDRAARGEVKKVVQWGFSGVRPFVREEEGVGAAEVGVRECKLTDVLERGKMGARGRVGAGQLSPVPTPPPSAHSTAPSAPSTAIPTSSAAPSAPPLPFSLTLTPSQLAARSLVSNPFHGADKPIYGEEGYRAPSLPGQSAAGSIGVGAAGGGEGRGASVEYVADEYDDLDEEDPDEDLEI
ncbi:hypothetical protein JCM11251_007414 [Rhodosporidiobolus azoricus]